MIDHNLHLAVALGKTIAITGSSGAWFELDELGRQIVENILNSKTEDEIIGALAPQYGADKVKSYFGELGSVINRSQSQTFNPSSRPFVINKMFLQVTRDCNLRCRYCYAQNAPEASSSCRMTKEVALKAVDLLLDENKQQKACYLDFDGGEPLLNFDLIKEIVSYIEYRAQAGGPRVLMTTASNGSTLTPSVRCYLKEHGIKYGVSFDGLPEVQNQSRPRPGGHESYNWIIGQIKEALIEDSINTQATVSPQSIEVDKTLRHLAELGFKPVQAEPCYASADPAWCLDQQDIPKLKDAFTRSAEDFLEAMGKNQIKPYFNFTDIIQKLSMGLKRHYGCSVGTRMCAVSPEGKIYPCYRFWGMDEYCMGTVDDGVNRSIQKKFADAHVDARQKCKECWARYFCGGKCIFLSVYYHKNLDQPYELNCQIFKHNLTLSMALFLHLKKKPQLLREVLTLAQK